MHEDFTDQQYRAAVINEKDDRAKACNAIRQPDYVLLLWRSDCSSNLLSSKTSLSELK